MGEKARSRKEFTLSWKRHLENVIRVATRRRNVVRVLKTFVSKEELLVVFSGVIMSNLLYACLLFVQCEIDDKRHSIRTG